MSGTADQEQDIVTTSALFWLKVSKEVCNLRMVPYDVRQIANDPISQIANDLRSNSTEANNGPIKEKRVSLRKRDLQK